MGRLHHGLYRRCFNTQPHEGGCTWQTPKYVFNWLVSTHSRAEAAATGKVKRRNRTRCFNTQPRGGGCKKSGGHKMQPSCFNTQPRGGGCICENQATSYALVSTHSRAEAAAYDRLNYLNRCSCFNTQPRGGGCTYAYLIQTKIKSFNTQPRGGGCLY